MLELLDCAAYRDSVKKMFANLDIDFLRGKSVLITGASGMLGSCLVDTLMVADLNCRVMVVSRNEDEAKRRFSPYWAEERFLYCRQDVCTPLENLPDHVDYIVHAASNADPVNMAKYPVDTLMANVAGTWNLLEYGRLHGMMRFLFVSSGEVYGQPDADISDFTEDYCGPLDLANPRSCYPEGKRAAEVLCQSYISQYGVDAVIVRPCHLFGPTQTRRDSRAVSEFLRNAAAGEDIVMKSNGLLERSHCYVIDAVKAILLVLKCGKCGGVYNIADKQYQMTIREFAGQAAEAGNCHVTYSNPSDIEVRGYSKITRAVLDSARIEALGWQPMKRDASAIRETVAILCGINA